ncbi:MAG: TonB family protein, partial [Deltaproteobacteria bacterium]|nr:TonB family protein [Deltaproteobacteria bacterium]
VVVLKFTIGQGGEIAGHAIARSSVHEVLDGAAAEASKRWAGFLPCPRPWDAPSSTSRCRWPFV